MSRRALERPGRREPERRRLPRLALTALALLGLGGLAAPRACAPKRSLAGLRIEVTFPPALRAMPADGRVLLILSTSAGTEPRFQVAEGPESQQIFGLDAHGLAPGEPAVFDGRTLGYPRASLAALPAGKYTVQAVLNLYETFHRADGKAVELHADHGEGQRWSDSPGNLLSAPVQMTLDPARRPLVRIAFDRIVPPVVLPPDSRYVQHVTMVSPLLSQFWGRPVELGAFVLLPDGFAAHPQARYPAVYYYGHFANEFATPGGFLESRPPIFLPADQEVLQSYAYRLYRDWTGGHMPRMLVVSLQHPNPYYDDSYGVNSANLGPYGDALAQELVPYVEKRFRAIGEPWARAVYGDSTGGWAALAQQVFHPETYNGVWALCPDPVDFRAFQTTDLYRDANVYWRQGLTGRVARPDSRGLDDGVLTTVEAMNRLERVLGSRGRSGDQFDAWEAVYGPAGEDGYPKPAWDKATGGIDPAVAAYWREHYDLTHVLERDWRTLGPHLAGKIHVTVGEKDSFYLDGAVRLLARFLAGTREAGRGPFYAGSVDIGAGQPHCYTGDPATDVTGARLSVNQRLLPQIERRMLETAPAGADVTSWRY
ncbi:MAG TPA: alpha/beta hydrolase-fold protein [Thermoanaerobaculia bacterium]